MWYSQLDRFGCIWCILGLWIIIIIVIKLRAVWEVLAYHQPFWWKPWWPDLFGHFQLSLSLHVGVTGRHLAWDAGVSTRSILKTRRGAEWRTLLLALALILNYTLKHTIKSFGTEVYNAVFGGLTPHSPQPLDWASHGKPTPSRDHGGIYTALCKRLGSPKLWTHLPVPPRDPQLSTCWGVLERQVGQVATHHRARNEREEGEKGPNWVKKSFTQVWSRKRSGNADGQFGYSVCICQAPGRGSPPPQGYCSPPTSPEPPQPSHTSRTSRSDPAWQRPGEEGEGMLRGWKEREELWGWALRKEWSGSGRSGDLPLSPGEPRPGGLAQPRLERCETLQDMALHSKMFLLVEATSHLLHVEHLLLPLLQWNPLPLHPSLSKREARSILILGFWQNGSGLHP